MLKAYLQWKKVDANAVSLSDEFLGNAIKEQSRQVKKMANIKEIFAFASVFAPYEWALNEP